MCPECRYAASNQETRKTRLATSERELADDEYHKRAHRIGNDHQVGDPQEEPRSEREYLAEEGNPQDEADHL